MPIMKFETEAVGKAQGGRLEIADTGERVLQHTLGGEPMLNRPNGAPGAEPAGRYNSYAPQVILERPTARLKRCVANKDTCMGWATATGYCSGHAMAMEDHGE